MFIAPWPGMAWLGWFHAHCNVSQFQQHRTCSPYTVQSVSIRIAHGTGQGHGGKPIIANLVFTTQVRAFWFGHFVTDVLAVRGEVAQG